MKKRPSFNGTRKPLALTDPIEWWEEEATRLRLSVSAYREQVMRADEIMEEIIAEDMFREKASAWFKRGVA